MLLGRVDLENNLVLEHTRGNANRLAEGSSHARAHTVCSCAGCERIFAENMMRINADFEMIISLANLFFKNTVGNLPRRFNGVVADLQVGL